ncbi:hypothetical protein C8R48DRAFT_600488, partial [Suillus tomentosus]
NFNIRGGIVNGSTGILGKVRYSLNNIGQAQPGLQDSEQSAEFGRHIDRNWSLRISERWCYIHHL